MGLIDRLFGAEPNASVDGESPDETHYAILINAGPEDFASASNGFGYALDLDDRGYDVQVFLDGQATKWPAEFAESPDRSFSAAWRQLQDRGLLAGACGYCANAFDAEEACQLEDVQLLSDEDEHAPSVGKLADEGYEILSIG